MGNWQDNQLAFCWIPVRPQALSTPAGWITKASEQLRTLITLIHWMQLAETSRFLLMVPYVAVWTHGINPGGLWGLRYKIMMLFWGWIGCDTLTPLSIGRLGTFRSRSTEKR